MPHTQQDSSATGEVGTRTILVIEDDEGIGELITLALAEASPSYFPLVVADAQEALRLLGSTPVALLVIDYHLADMNGLELYDALRHEKSYPRVGFPPLYSPPMTGPERRSPLLSWPFLATRKGYS
jgi:CheY-like chemotaxis protein